MSEEADRSELERLKAQKYEDESKRWDALFLGQRQTLESLTRIETKCIACQRTLDAHDAALHGDVHAGTSGLVSAVKDAHITLHGSPAAPNTGLVQTVDNLNIKMERINGRVGLMWKGVGIAFATAVTAAAKVFWRGGE